MGIISLDIFKGLFGDKGLAGGVVDVLQKTGILKDNEMIEKTAKALQDYELSLKGKQNELEQILSEDRKSAREREIATKDKTPRNLAIIAITGFFGILITLIFVTVPPTAKDALLIMLGTLAGMVTSVVQYYFGSSSGSSQKNQMIDRLLKEK